MIERSSCDSTIPQNLPWFRKYDPITSDHLSTVVQLLSF